MSLIKTTDLIGRQLDWAVAKCLAQENGATYVTTSSGKLFISDPLNPPGRLNNFCPSKNWSQGGPIIQREGISLSYFDDHDSCPWDVCMQMKPRALDLEGFEPLVLAMRCYVSSKFGESIDVPEELL